MAMSQFGMWSRVLPAKEIKDMADCNVEGRGSMFTWDVQNDWKTFNVDAENVPLSSLCQEDDLQVSCIGPEKDSY